jgi:hypothetical protein
MLMQRTAIRYKRSRPADTISVRQRPVGEPAAGERAGIGWVYSSFITVIIALATALGNTDLARRVVVLPAP